MQTPLATLRILFVTGSFPWGDSAYSPEQNPAMVALLPIGRGVVARFGGSDGTNRGQSYDLGAHPPR